VYEAFVGVEGRYRYVNGEHEDYGFREPEGAAAGALSASIILIPKSQPFTLGKMV
jgi:hypothetical protein